MRRLFALATVAGMTLLGLVAVGAPAASGATRTVCPPGGASNTTYNGGLLVTDNNFCSLDHVTVNGGIVVDSGSDVDLETSTVHGGVVVTPGGEIEVGISLFSGITTHSVVTGGLRLRRPVDWDIETATISGGVRIVGGVRFSPTICGNTIKGGLTVAGVETEETWIGDPESEEGIIAGRPCEGNRISGSLSLTSSSGFDVEGNVVGGSVLLRSSTLDLNGNRIRGSLLCSKGTVIFPPEAPDPSGNSVHGKNTC